MEVMHAVGYSSWPNVQMLVTKYIIPVRIINSHTYTHTRTHTHVCTHFDLDLDRRTPRVISFCQYGRLSKEIQKLSNLDNTQCLVADPVFFHGKWKHNQTYNYTSCCNSTSNTVTSVSSHILRSSKGSLTNIAKQHTTLWLQRNSWCSPGTPQHPSLSILCQCIPSRFLNAEGL